mgnify:CR=1 FL=1|tara:strand:+ start:914 stop:1699 length:786 start_codon:yes stop_codon:yes gene_type:complete
MSSNSFLRILFIRFIAKLNHPKHRLIKSKSIHYIRDAEYSSFSQHNEDGILDFLTSKISKHKKFLEIGFHATESNCLNLALNKSYSGCFIDADEKHCNLARNIYKKLSLDVSVMQTYVNKNINDIYIENFGEDEIDVFSIDIDGIDYWVWEHLHFSPRIVVVEYNSSIDISNGAAAVPYADNFNNNGVDYYHGASLAAFNKLAKTKKYTLACCESFGVNAFYIRNDLVSRFKKHELSPYWIPNRGRYRGENKLKNCKFIQI